MKNGLHRHYDRLVAEERFRLDVLAMARGDMRESERLTRSCPRFSYTMNDRRFAGRWTGILEITLRMYVAMGEQLAKLQMVDALRELVPYSQAVSHMMIVEAYLRGHESGSRYAWGRADKPGKPPGYLKASWEANENVDSAMDKDLDDFEGTIAQYGGFLPEVLDRME